MVLARVVTTQSWDSQAAEYRAIAYTTSDVLERLGYLQRAEYCEAMAARQQRCVGVEPSAVTH